MRKNWRKRERLAEQHLAQREKKMARRDRRMRARLWQYGHIASLYRGADISYESSATSSLSANLPEKVGWQSLHRYLEWG